MNQVSFSNLYLTNNDFALFCNSSFDVGVNTIVNYSGVVRPGNNANFNLVAGDLSQISNLNCASGMSGTVKVWISGPASFTAIVPGSIIPNFSADSLFVCNY
ncbi:MAG: hypothetical protein IPK10_17100 [Bacteroidetes bacterium]|nr:hypothetical protein [Bacteroidota bacterium]